MPQRGNDTGATFALEEIGYLDYETLSKIETIKNGTYRYASDADAIILAYAIGNAPTRIIAVDNFPQTLHWRDMPPDFKAHHERVLAGDAIWAAWNAGFDKAVWNYACADFPYLDSSHIIDVMAQATASGLAPDLASAARQSGSMRKDERGKGLIKLFCLPESTATPLTHPDEWRDFVNYAGDDIEAMRSVFTRTRQLPWPEWQHYWAAERINERGAAVDMRMIAHAAKLAEEDKRRSKTEISRLTKGDVETVDQVQRMTGWLHRRLPVSGRDILTKREEEIDEETGVITRPAKFSLTRKQVERLIAMLKTLPENSTNLTTLRVLQIRLYGGSKTPVKFSRMLAQQVDGVLFGQYVFNGAPQTGRFSSKGTQIHNLSREALDHEPDLINALLHECPYERLVTLGSNEPVARKLALLIRPALVPKDDQHVFVWSDWSQIEARITPWLAGDDPRAAQRLQIFRDVDADPRQDKKHPDYANRIPDLYTRSASDISHIPIERVTKDIRQRGKVAELALTFLGGIGALQSMGANYGIYIEDSEARLIVARWREANGWATDFGAKLWEAMREAHSFPGTFVTAGRIGFVFLQKYLGGSMLMRLPSGRCLTYRSLKWRQIDILDDDDKPTGDKETKLTCLRGYAKKPIPLWPGLLVENATQGTAADFLRGTLVRLENPNLSKWMPVRLHVHDEILVETETTNANEAREILRDMMQKGFDWSDGLPLMSEETICYQYSKHEDSYGL